MTDRVKLRFRIVIISFLLFSVVGAFAQSAAVAVSADTLTSDSVSLPWDERLKSELAELVADKSLATSHVGICVYDITADSLLFDHHGNQLLRPASTMKLLTSITALSKLGGAYTFNTHLYQTGEVVDTVLSGNLYVVGSFDPKFSTDDLHAMVDCVQQLGIKRIAGGIFADMSMKDSIPYGQGWSWDDENPKLIPLQLNQRNVVLKEFERRLKEVGISVDTTGLALCPMDNARLLVRRFHTIDQVLLRMMKRSDNLYAEAMFYQLPRAGKHGLYANASQAADVIGSLIRKVGFVPSDYNIADGSGLSPYNYLSAELLVGFLRYAYANPMIFNHLYPSLPVAGNDGTLSSRMKTGKAENNVHAKTGTLRGVSSLAGYATASNGHFIAFAIINQGIMRQATGRNWQDKVCQAICR